MSENEAPLNEDTPDSGGSDTQDIPWQKRYEDLRPEFDRTTQALKDEQAVWEDEQQLIDRVAERYPHLISDDEEAYEEDDALGEDEEALPASDPRFDQLAPEVDLVRAWVADQQYEKDLARFVGDRELSDHGREIVQALCERGGNNADALKKAVDKWFTTMDESQAAAVDALKRGKRGPHVPSGGRAATGVKDTSEMSRRELDAYMLEQVRASSA